MNPPKVRRTPGRRGRPPLLSRDQVLDAAVAIVDADGLEALTMRRLGAALGVDPMAIYHHVPDKSALFDALVERAYEEIVIPEPTGEWQDDLRALCRAARTAFLVHPHLVVLVGTRPPITEVAFDLVEATTAIALRAGFSERLAADTFDCAGRLIIGHVLAEAGRPPGGEVGGGEAEHRAAQRALAPERFPSLTAVERAAVAHDPARLFELALDGLIAALGSAAERRYPATDASGAAAASVAARVSSSQS
jgi:TetR/AcrR family tetracycline transcriptional repressor